MKLNNEKTKSTLKSEKFYTRLRTAKAVFLGIAISITCLMFAGSMYHVINTTNKQKEMDAILREYSETEEFKEVVREDLFGEGRKEKHLTFDDMGSRWYVLETLKSTKEHTDLKQKYEELEKESRVSDGVAAGLSVGVIAGVSESGVLVIDILDKKKKKEPKDKEAE